MTEAQTKATEKKAEKMALEIKRERVLIALCATGIEAVERIGAGQAVEADFEVIDNLKQIGVKIPPKIKSAAFLLKQTVRVRKMRNEKGQFAQGNTFAQGHGAPKGNQNAKGPGAPARNINAVKHGIYTRWENGEGPKDRLPPGGRRRGVRGANFRKRIVGHSCAGLIAGRAGRREDGKTSLSVK